LYYKDRNKEGWREMGKERKAGRKEKRFIQKRKSKGSRDIEKQRKEGNERRDIKEGI
jgi:hypothetical protein